MSKDIKINDIGLLGFKWYTAMCYGLTQISNNDKEIWFNNNENNILNLDNLLIDQAIDKIDFIGCCLAYKDYIKNGFMSFDLKFDATCSGIQHISALLEDQNLGNEVNIKISNFNEKPNDIYTKLIEPIKAELNKFVFENETNTLKYIDLLKFNINRQLIKRPIMTIPYTVSIYGIADHIISLGEVIKEKIAENNITKVHYEFKDINNNIFVLNKSQIMIFASIIYKTILKEYPVLSTLFTYYNKMISLLLKYDLDIIWITPTGVEIHQNYIKLEDEKIRMFINRKTRNIIIKKPIIPFVPDKIKSKNAIIPNIIHSLDSSHLNMIINDLLLKDINILPIHDCFIISPNNTMELYNSFILMYLKLYSNQSFINNFHNLCIKSLQSIHKIHKELDNYVITDTGEVIPNNPYQNNPSFFINVKNSTYMIK